MSAPVSTDCQATGTDCGATDEMDWLTPDQQREWRSLLAMLATLPSAFDAQLKRDAGLNRYEYQVLAALSEAPDRTLGLSTIAALTQGSLSRLSHAVTRLERSGWVGRRTCVDGGGRRTEAWLTEAGTAKLEEIAPGHVREARRLVVDVLTPEQLAALGEIARTITAAAAEADPERYGPLGSC
ncbi:MarR family winged helix-turn-helix transcriptional regulator [Auraticoccus monumenti]|uniref:DNA-binding transcriptional regulator, MarR family n=1 Tax=Auraticoccus monumenti TaxID=675864 RepID=A0A1G7ELD7_9ACTN|nr:MarR family winged helix-turn-helix transcriptional regulator [Auraticoccus monumenti]SDE64543.1 DNA-binding transcriptional regulator, MarR family [Auraticoccus monumenti]